MIAGSRPALPAPPAWRQPARWRQEPLVIGLLVLLVLLPTCIALGRWQWQKGEEKAAQQALRDARGDAAPLALPATALTGDAASALQYRRLLISGRFLPERQFLLDNRVHRGRAGFHLITPFRPTGSAAVLLVNRGWLPAGDQGRRPPEFTTPERQLDLSGVAVLPPRNLFSLAANGNNPDWSSARLPVWQTLDLESFARQSGLTPHQLIFQLDATAPAGFGRDWPRPDERIERHYSYALQWFGFAVSGLAIWLYFLYRRLGR